MTMIQIVRSFFEEMFFKTRYIFLIRADDKDILNIRSDLPDISFERIRKDNFPDLKFFYPKENSDYFIKILEKRLNNPGVWQGYLVRSKDTPVGSFWLLIPDKEKKRYDNFWVDTTSIMFCSGIVHPLYRGKHVFTMMHYFCFDLLKKMFPTKKIIAIVEKKNSRSMNSFRRSNVKNIGRNFLVKILGRNIISIFKRDRGGTSIYFLVKILGRNIISIFKRDRGGTSIWFLLKTYQEPIY
jgi:hypothetical protein